MQTLKDLIAMRERNIARLEAQYDGVRPGWVSAEIGREIADLRRLQNELAALQEEADANGWEANL